MIDNALCLSLNRPGQGGIFEAKERVGHRLVTAIQTALGDKTLGSTPACKETRGVVSLPYLGFFALPREKVQFRLRRGVSLGKH